MKHIRTLGVLVVLVAALSACGDSEQHQATSTLPSPSATVATPRPPQPMVYRITIDDFTYSHLTVAAGDIVSVVNKDDVEHTITSDTGAFEVEVGPRAETQLVAPATPGTYKYHCEYHPAMHGELVVY